MNLLVVPTYLSGPWAQHLVKPYKDGYSPGGLVGCRSLNLRSRVQGLGCIPCRHCEGMISRTSHPTGLRSCLPEGLSSLVFLLIHAVSVGYSETS